MKKLKILLVSFIFCSVMQTNAQVSFAPKLGLNFANLSGDIEDNKTRLKPEIGFVLDYSENLLSFQTGLSYNAKGATFDYDEDDKDAITLDYLEIPLNCILNLDLYPSNVQIFAGAYLGFCIDAKYRYLSDGDNEMESFNIGTSDNDDIKPLDFGLNIGLGYKFNNFQIQGKYSTSLTNLSNYEDENLKNSLISLSIAYFINFEK